MYATSRSLRLPQFSVDAAGIPPDQVLPVPVDAAGSERRSSRCSASSNLVNDRGIGERVLRLGQWPLSSPASRSLIRE